MDHSFLNKEKIKSVIDELQRLFSQDAAPEKLLETAHVLVRELHPSEVVGKEKKNISVVMPSSAFTNIIIEKKSEPQENVVPEEKPEIISEENPVEEEIKEDIKGETILPITEVVAEVPEEKKSEKEAAQNIIEKEEPVAEKEMHNPAWNIFGSQTEAPTIAYYKAENETKDINDIFSSQSDDIIQSSLNTPIHDLTTAIGINDRYLFINELFRGDEFMYERSIITLNKFSAYEQAHAWAERELRLKLGWDLGNPITKQFERLVKRKFGR